MNSRSVLNHKLKVSCLFVSTLIFLAVSSQTVELRGQGRQEILVTRGDLVGASGQLNFFSRMFLNDAGDVSFQASLSGTTGGATDDIGVYRRSAGGTLGEIAREGQLVPDNNGTFSFFSIQGLNENGQVLFRSALNGSTGGFSDDTGLFVDSGFGPVFVVREGNAPPNGNGSFSGLSSVTDRYGFNNSGQVSFQNTLLGTSGGTSDDSAIFRGNSLSQIVREGDLAPGGGNFTAFGSTTKINDSGEIAFIGNVVTDTGIYRFSGNSITPIYVEGQAAPDFNGTMSFASGFMTMNNAGQVAFEAVMTGTANGLSDSEGIFRGDGGNVVQIMREGNSAFGNGVFQSSLSTSVRINESGQVAFSSVLRETSGGTTDDSGIYRSSSSGTSLVEIAREGDAISSGDGLMGSIAFTQTALNDQGHVAFQASVSGTANNSAVFIGDGRELITVVQEGQSLNGSTVTSLEFTGGEQFQSGLNNHGQLVYEANLANGTSTIQQWTPDVHWRETFGSSWSSSSRWTLGISPDSLYDTFIDPDSSLTVTGNVDANVRSLQIGGGTGTATLRLSGATITPENGATIQSTGVLTGNGTIAGDVNNSGTFIADNVIVSGNLTNQGVIRGNGRVDSNIINSSSGEIRVGDNEYMQLTGSGLNNSGRIEVIDGELEVASNVQNNSSSGLITGRNATMRFNGGVTNQGALAYSFGVSDVFGDINNDAGTISIGGGGEVTFYDDILQNGNFEVVAAGSRTSSAVVLGDFSGAGGFSGGGDVFLLGDLRPGNSPGSVLMDGNLFLGSAISSLFEFEGTSTGEFDQLIVTGNLSLAGDLNVELLNGYLLDLNQQYVIADVNGELFGEFDGLSEGDVVNRFGGIDLFITYLGGDGNDVALFTSVPEPSFGLICMAAIGGMFLRRKRF